jgi:small subunit ribosomal protein S28e
MGKKKKQKKAAKKAAKKGAKRQQKKRPIRERKGGKQEVSEYAVSARIMEIIGKMGTREGGKQIRVKVLEGRDANKVIRRNVLGPVKIGDILMLKETEIEASPLKGRKG